MTESEIAYFRLECLRLAVSDGSGNAIFMADEMFRFIFAEKAE